MATSWRWVSPVALATLAAACGPSRAPGTNGDSATHVSIAVSPAQVELAPGTTARFSASVTGTADAAVSWSVAEGDAGGRVSADGLYTAPATLGVYHVVAASHADGSRTATASVVVSTSPPAISVSVSPSSATLAPGASQQFTATVTGAADAEVSWWVVEGDAGGTVDASGRYVAPAAEGTYHVEATSRADPSRSDRATVVVASSQLVSVRVDPATATVAPGASLRFTATVQGTSEQRVGWSVLEGAAGGTVDGSGTYTAPAAPGTYHVVATSHADPSRQSSAEVLVRSAGAVAISIAPTSADVLTGGSVQFRASVSGATDGRVAWSVQEGAPGGTVDATGAYVAPSSPGTMHVVATSVADPSRSAVAAVTVRAAATTVEIRPASATVALGTGFRFAAIVNGVEDAAAVVWSVAEGAAGGSIDVYGGYRPVTTGTFHVVATSRSDPGVSARAEVTAVASGGLSDYGGPVLADVHVYAIWWGDRQAFGDAIAGVEHLFQGMSGSSWLATLDQYLRGARPRVTFERHLYDGSAPPTQPPITLDEPVCRAIAANGLTPDAAGLYFVYLLVPSVAPFPYGGFHSWTTCDGVLVHTALALADGGNWFSCGDGLSHAASYLVGVSTHELAEAMTDPGPDSAWQDDSQEVADKCAFSCATFGSVSFGAAGLWSNSAGACVPQ